MVGDGGEEVEKISGGQEKTPGAPPVKKLAFPGAASRLDRVMAEDPEKVAEARIAAEQSEEENLDNLRDAILSIVQPYYELLRATAESGDAVPNKKKNPDFWTIKWEDTKGDIRNVSSLVIDKHDFKYNNPRSYRLDLFQNKDKFAIIEATCGEGSITEVSIGSQEHRPELLSKYMKGTSPTEKIAYDEFIRRQLDADDSDYEEELSDCPLVVLHAAGNPSIALFRWYYNTPWALVRPKRESFFDYDPQANHFKRRMSDKQLRKQNGKFEAKDTVSVDHYLDMLSSALHLLPAEQAA